MAGSRKKSPSFLIESNVHRRRRRRRRRRVGAVTLSVTLAVAVAALVALASRPPQNARSGSAGASPAASTGESTRESGAAAPATPGHGKPDRSAKKATPAKASKVTFAATGDVAMGRTPVLPPDGGATFFAHVERQLRGDVVLGNLETALTNGEASKCGVGSANCFAFRAPPSYARWLEKAGFTVMNLANNHSYDFGAQGQAETVAALERFGVRHTGRPGEIAYQRVGRLTVAILGFAPYPWAQDLLDLRAARRLVRRADAKADVVVATMHAGAEGADRMHVRPGGEVYLGEARGDPMRFARAVIDAGADLVVGHGPHVLRGMEWYRGRLIAYSLGNFSGYHNFSLSGSLSASAILRVTLRGDGTWAGGRLVATQLVGDGLPAPDPGRRAQAMVRELSRADFGQRAARIVTDGSIRPPSGKAKGT